MKTGRWHKGISDYSEKCHDSAGVMDKHQPAKPPGAREEHSHALCRSEGLADHLRTSDIINAMVLDWFSPLTELALLWVNLCSLLLPQLMEQCPAAWATRGSSSLLEPVTFRAHLRSTTVLVHRSSFTPPKMASQKKKNLIQFHHGQFRSLHQKGLFNPFSISIDRRKNWKNTVLSQELPRFDSHSPEEESLGEKETEGHLPPATGNVKN